MLRLACLLIMGCRAAVPTAEEDTDRAPEDTSNGDDSSTGYLSPEVCPCEQIDAAWRLCQDAQGNPSEGLRERAVVASMASRSSSDLVEHEGALFVRLFAAEDDEPDQILRWAPGDAEFVRAFDLPTGESLTGAASSSRGLLLLLEPSSQLARWTPEDGLQVLAEFGELDTNSSATSFQPLRVLNDRALFALDQSAAFEDVPRDAAAVVEVDLTDGSFQLLPFPLAGAVPTQTGWLGLRPQPDEWQFCCDYSCCVEPTTIAWDLISDGSTLASDGCVDSSYQPSAVEFATLHDEDYIAVSRIAARRTRPGGSRELLWSGGRIADALLAADTLYISTSYEGDGTDPGAGRHELLQIDLLSGGVERIAALDHEDYRQSFRLGMTDGTTLWVAAPLSDGKYQLEALAL